MKTYLVKGAVNGRSTEMEFRAHSAMSAREMFFTIYGRVNVVVYSTTEVKR